MFGQTFELHDLIVIGVLVVLEGVLSIDNALVLGLLARRLPRGLQKKALTYGLVGAIVFRIIAVGTAAWLLHWRLAKLLGGLYLLWVAVKHFASRERAHHDERLAVDQKGRPILIDEKTGQPVTQEQAAKELGWSAWADYAHAASARSWAFWLSVAAIELTDIAFAVDSIVAAIGVVGPPRHGQRHPKLWVIITGGLLGVMMMRFAAVLFIKLLERFPRFETSAYLLVTVIGAKLTLDYFFPEELNLNSPRSIWFWVFWAAMMVAFAVGFIPQKKQFPS